MIERGDFLKPLILVIEYNSDIAFNLNLTLKFNNYEVITASNWNDALILLSEYEKTPDLIISDIIIPGSNTLDFFDKISKNPRWRHIPYIFLTTRTSPEDIKFAEFLGAKKILFKPFKEEDLFNNIQKVLNNDKKSDFSLKFPENEGPP